MHRIGNLTLLSKGSNSAASNKNFTEKKKIYTKEAEDEAYNTALLTDARSQKEWTLEIVEERQGRILNAVKAWLYKPATFYELGKE